MSDIKNANFPNQIYDNQGLRKDMDLSHIILNMITSENSNSLPKLQPRDRILKISGFTPKACDC